MMRYDTQAKEVAKVLEKNKIVIYGAGRTTEQILKRINDELKSNIIGIIDSSPQKNNKKINGITIYRPGLIEELKPEYIIVSVEDTLTSREIVDSLSTSIKILDLNELIIQESSAIILVYTIGKVGSKTIVKSLNNSIATYIFDIHHLNNNSIKIALENCNIQGKSVYRGIKDAQYLRKFIINNKKKYKWKIVTLVREPLSQSIAGFFQNIDSHLNNFTNRYKTGKLKIEDVINRYIEKQTANSPYDGIEKWFESELKEVFNFDVFQHDFCKEKGYEIYYHENIELLLIRLEDLNHCANKAFYEFLGIKDFKLYNNNLASKKDYYEAYVKFKNNITFKKDDLDKIYNSRFVKHFYNEEEIKQFRKKWREKD